MNFSRISSSSMIDQSLYYLNTNLKSLSDLQEKMSSGKNINAPGDDPVGLTRVLNLTTTLGVDARYAKNVQDAVSETNTADSAVTNMVNLVQRAQELTTQAANVTNNQSGRDAIALEIDQIINQLVQLGNTDIGGKYIFAGVKTDTPPFSRTNDDITYSGTPSGQNWQRNTEIGRGVQLTTNINGATLLGNVQVTTAGPPLPPTFAAGSGGLFKTLVELKQDLQAGGATNQLTEIRNRLDDLTADLSTLTGQQSILGAVGNRLSITQSRIDERKSILTQQYSDLQNVDMPKTIADLNAQQNVLQASMSVTGKILQMNLLDYLR